jgi:hypothetical protein
MRQFLIFRYFFNISHLCGFDGDANCDSFLNLAICCLAKLYLPVFEWVRKVTAKMCLANMNWGLVNCWIIKHSCGNQYVKNLLSVVPSDVSVITNFGVSASGSLSLWYSVEEMYDQNATAFCQHGATKRIYQSVHHLLQLSWLLCTWSRRRSYCSVGIISDLRLLVAEQEGMVLSVTAGVEML